MEALSTSPSAAESAMPGGVATPGELTIAALVCAALLVTAALVAPKAGPWATSRIVPVLSQLAPGCASRPSAAAEALACILVARPGR